MGPDELFEGGIGYPFPEAEGPKVRDPLPACGGVYLLTDELDRLVVLASAGNLRRAIRGRLSGGVGGAEAAEVSGSRRRAALGEVVRRVRWRTADSPFEIGWR